MGIDVEVEADGMLPLKRAYSKATIAPPVRAQIIMVKIDSVLFDSVMDALEKHKAACDSDIASFGRCREEIDSNGYYTAKLPTYVMLQACLNSSIKKAEKNHETSTMELVTLRELQVDMADIRQKLEARCSKTGNLQEKLQPLFR